ncbi:MAG: MerR family transcriptional regulator [Ilumatobacteraceae bacterium]
MEREHHAVYVISVAAELAGMHPQTLRIYERRGLITPSRTSGGNRRYSEADIQRLLRIAHLTSLGMNIEGIRQVMELEQQVLKLRDEALRLQAELEHASSAAQKRNRNELVPLRQAMTLFGRLPSIFEEEE